MTRGYVGPPVSSANLAVITVAMAIIIVWAWIIITIIPRATITIVGRAIAATTAGQMAVLIGDVAVTIAEAQPGSLPTSISTTATGFEAVAKSPHIPTGIEVRAPWRTTIPLAPSLPTKGPE
jgi:hypothetical protein